MPPPPPIRADRYIPDTQNTRALLRSLEELRDSLSTRVEQLSQAVERLRSQARDLERAFATEGDDDLGLSRLSLTDDPPLVASSNIVLASRRQSSSAAAQGSANARSARQPRDSPAHRAPSAIQSDVSQLHRPITMDEIASLLDRAAQPTFQQAQSPHGPLYYPDGVPAPATQPQTRNEADQRAVERINALREELRVESSRLGNWIHRIPDPPTLTWRESNVVRPTGQGDSGSRRAARAHNERVRLLAVDHRRSTSPRAVSRATASADLPLMPRHGLPPTNTRTTPPAPVVVRSSPLSPASTVTPDHILSSAFSPLADSSEDSLGSESPPALAPIPLPEVSTPPRSDEPSPPPVEPASRSILVQTETTESSHHLHPIHVRVTSPHPDEVVLNLPTEWGDSTFFDMSPSTSTAPRPRARPHSTQALTSRGMRVEASLNPGSSGFATTRAPAAGAERLLDFDESSFLSSFPSLRDLFQDPTVPSTGSRYQEPRTDSTSLLAGLDDLALSYTTAVPGESRNGRHQGHRDSTGVPYIGLRTGESPMDREVAAIRREEGEHLRSLAQDIVRSRSNQGAAPSGSMPDAPNTEQSLMIPRSSAERRRLRDALRNQRLRDERNMADEDPETPSLRDRIASAPRANYSPTAAATIATSARTETDSTASASTAGGSASTSLQRETSRGTQVDSPLTFDQLSSRFDRHSSGVRAALDRSRVRMRELAERRRDYEALQARVSRTRDSGEVDLVQVLQNGENAQEARAAVERARRQSEGDAVFEGSGQRREAGQHRNRRQQDQSKDEMMHGTGTAGPLKDKDLDAHLWLDMPVAQNGHRRHRPYISMLDLEL